MHPFVSGAHSLALRLLALIVVPLVGLGILATQRIGDDTAEARAAQEMVDSASFVQRVAAVTPPAQFEQIALEGLASVDALGVPRDLVVSFTGVDLSVYFDNAFELDAALDDLSARHGDLTMTDGTTLRFELDRFRAELERQRALFDDGLARQADIRETFAELADLLDAAVVAYAATEDARSVGDVRPKLSSLSTVLDTAGDRGRALIEGLLDGSTEQTEQAIAAAARLDLAVEQLRSTLDADEVGALDELMSHLEPLPDSTRRVQPQTIAAAIDRAYVRATASAVLNQFDFLELLELYSDSLHADVVDALEQQAADAEAATDRTKLLVLATVVVSLLLLGLLAWTILRPLRRLTQRAELIGNGDFDADPLPVSGPSDVRTLTSTVNDMADTLAGVDREITRLADSGSIDSEIQLPGTIGQSIDRSFRRLGSMTTRLHASESLASAIVAQAADAIWTIDADGRIRSANDASVVLLGVAVSDQLGTSIATRLSSLDGEITVEHASGRTAHVVVSSSEIDDAGVIAVMAHDISERRRFQEQLAHQAHHDALTGLPNRIAVLDRLDRTDPTQPLAVLFVDLDGFKSVNDMQGHLVGDRVLTEVGRRLSEQVRDGDLVGRLGGDEFVIVMDGLSAATDAIGFAEHVVADLERPYRDGASAFSLSASVGVATFDGGLGAERLTPLDAIQRADSAVYAAKARGRGVVEVFTTDLEDRLTHDAEIEHSLRQAITRDELELHLQPVLHLASNTFTSAEALVRWNRPGFGVMPPGEFIPIAEKSALIEDIGRWVIDRACRTVVDWRNADSNTTARIAINIAGSHLLNGDLVADVDAALFATGADPRMLEIELTETQLMTDYDTAKEVLQKLRQRGITVAIDDFGTGYSSMAYLRELPIDTLKIDRSFVAPIEHEGSDTTVIDALLTIGHALGLSIVAEGIETELQLAHFASRGCDRAQGFLMARPQPVDHATPLMGSRYGHALTLG